MTRGLQSPPKAITTVRPKLRLFGTTEGRAVHLMATVHTEWRAKPRAYYRAVAVCGVQSGNARLVETVPDDKPLCEDCVWPQVVPVVYEVLDHADDLIYVGYSGHLLRRLDQHRRGSAWWHEAARVTWTEYPSAVEALHAEHMRIRSAGPRHNCPSGRRAPRSLPPSLHHLYEDFAAIAAETPAA